MPTISTPNYKPFTTVNHSIWLPTGAVTNNKVVNRNVAFSPSANVRNTVSNKDYKTFIAQGKDATNPYTTFGVESKSMRIPRINYESNVNYTNPRGVLLERGSARGFPAIPTIDLSIHDNVLRDIALGRLKRKINEKVDDAKILAPVGELREFRGLVHSAVNLSLGLVKTLSDIKRTKGKSAFKYASDAWLTYGFGVKPMITDIQNIANAIDSYAKRQDLTYRESGSASKVWSSSFKASGLNIGATGITGEVSCRLEHRLSYRYISAYAVNSRSANDYGLLEHLGVELPQLIPAFWELTAFSWLFDYFGTVGFYLDDQFSSDITSSKFVVLNKRYIVDVTYNFSISPPPLYPSQQSTVVWNQIRPGFYRVYYFDRSKLSSLPPLMLRFKTVDEVGRNALNRLLNLGAVLVSGNNRYKYGIFK